MFRATLVPALLIASAASWGQPAGITFDFEDGIGDWQREGGAFDGQPYCGEISSNVFAGSKLGGNYWKDLAYPLGLHGSCLLTTIRKSAEGALTSREFLLSPSEPYLSFRIGGTEDLAHQRLELEVKVPPAEQAAVARENREWRGTHGEPERDGDYLVAYAATGHGTNMLRQETVEIPQFLRGRPARFRVLDRSAAGHINVDYIRFTASSPPALPTPLFGFADYHTHPMSYLALGGLKTKPIHTLWGNPGGVAADYETGKADIKDDIPHCVRGHDGGYFAEAFINSSQLLNYNFAAILESILIPHKRSGGPEFKNFPEHLMGAHEQMHVSMIHRSYLGGLRLMVALATDNAAAQFLTGAAVDGKIEIVQEKASIEAQLKGMKDFAALNHDWMEVVYTPEGARNAILHDRLAIVLGVEVDRLGELGLSKDMKTEPQLEADYLWCLGARAVIPIHAADNKIGGPAVFIEPYNWLNDLLHRDNLNATSSEVRKTSPQYFQIQADDAACSPNPRNNRGECVLRALDPDLELRVAIGRPLFNWFRPSPVILFAPHQDQFVTLYGHKNQQGLQAFGRDYIGALMDRGMILDTAHMSDLSVLDTYREIGKRLAPGCQDIRFADAPECDAAAYPAIISHAHFRAQAIYGNTQADDYKPSEYDIGDGNLKMVRRLGGVVGPFVTEARIDPDQSGVDGLKFPADCGNSSVNFAYSFRYADRAVNTPADVAAWASRVGFATDMTLIPTVSPRFGDHACDGYTVVKHGMREKAAHPERYRKGDDLRRNSTPQSTCEIVYRDRPLPPNPCKNSDPLTPSVLDKRTYDFNVDGLAHYGLLPDMLQDLKNLEDPDLKVLFRSAEGYLQMWEKVVRVRGQKGMALKSE